MRRIEVPRDVQRISRKVTGRLISDGLWVFQADLSNRRGERVVSHLCEVFGLLKAPRLERYRHLMARASREHPPIVEQARSAGEV